MSLVNRPINQRILHSFKSLDEYRSAKLSNDGWDYVNPRVRLDADGNITGVDTEAIPLTQEVYDAFMESIWTRRREAEKQ